MNFTKEYHRYAKYFEGALTKVCAEMNYVPEVLTESMRYSLLLGGKRVRPVLFLSTLEMFGKDYREEYPIAVALEAIHTYSLIHDDLPAMDNDDFRRGHASNHKAFGEANAILAGDALLSFAFDLLIRECARGSKHIAAARELSSAAGAEGMIAGQSADLLYTGKNGNEEELDFIYRHKTGKLIAAPLIMGALLSDGDAETMRSFGENLGILFQLTDDLLDVKGAEKEVGKTLGKDLESDKLTCIKVFGAEESEKIADNYAEQCLELLNGLPGADFLRGVVEMVRKRNH